MFYLVAVFTVIIQVISFSLEAGVAYYSAKNEITPGRLMAFALGWSLLSIPLVAGLFCIAGGIFNSAPGYPLSYPVVFISGCLLISFGNAICFSRYRYMVPGLMQVIISAACVLLLVSGTAIDHRDLFFYSFAAHGLLLYVLMVICYRDFLPDFRLRPEMIRKIFLYSSHAFIANLVFFIFNRVDYYFVKEWCSPEDLGNFIQVSRIAQLFFLLPSMISTVVFPLVVSDEENLMPGHVRKLSARMLVLFSAIAIIPAVSGKWLFPFVFGPSFDNMYIPFLLIIPGVIAMCSLYPYTAYFSGRNRIMVNVKGSLAGMLIVVAGDLLMVPSGGIRAAALVRGVGYLVYLVSVLSVFKKETGPRKPGKAGDFH